MEAQSKEATIEIFSPIATRKNDIVWIKFNRSNKANALNSKLLTSILKAMEKAESCPDVKAVILKGDGDNFCAGADLAELLSQGSKSVRSLLDIFKEVTRCFETSPLAVVAAVHGAARAGGIEFILACDAVVASEDATIGDAHMLRELTPAGGSSVRLPAAIGHQRAKWMILSGQSIDAHKALEWGIVNEVVQKIDLDIAAAKLAREISVGSRVTMRLAKRLMSDTKILPFEHALENEIRVIENYSETEAFKRNIGKFLKL